MADLGADGGAGAGADVRAAGIQAAMAEVVGADQVLTGDRITEDYCHDEALSMPAQRPAMVVRP
ncbi:MAG TPA: hypothetical protein VK735_02325, partial [Pseudonocardia sp.]|nr:hypothetical protein [Pseudonocardia sp.]